MFLNYFADDELASPVNIAAGRVVISFYLIWKLLSYDFGAIGTGLPPLTDRYGFSRLPILLDFIELEVALTVLVLALFALGYRERATAFLSCLLVTHLAMVRFGWNWSGGTTADFLAVYFIAFYGIYRHHDVLSVDWLYRSERTLSEFNELLQGDDSEATYPAPMLKWSLVTLALIYFGSAFGKAVNGPLLAWIQPESLMLHTHRMGELAGPGLVLNDFLATTPMVAFLASVGTIILEGGFLVAVLAGGWVTPFALGLFAMVVIVAISMGPFFFDVVLFLGALANWEPVFSNAEDDVTVVYDEHCYFCVQSLAPFTLLDVTDSVSFYSQYTKPEQFDSSEYDYESAMYLFDGEAHRGYYAFARLMRHYPLLSPFGYLMGLSPVSIVGEHVYEYIAANRNQYFICSIEDAN